MLDSFRTAGKWALAVFLVVAGIGLQLVTLEPSSDPNVAPWWLGRVAGVVLALAGLCIVLPKRPALLAFAALFVIAAVTTALFPFRPGELKSTVEIFTPFGYYARRLGDTPTRVMAALVALFAIGAVSGAIPQALKDGFGERRWLSVIQGVGLLIIVPFLFALIALIAVMASPVLAWRFFEQRIAALRRNS